MNSAVSAAPGADSSRCVGRRLECPQRRRADREDAPATRARRRDRLRRRLRYRVALAVHAVLRQVLGRDRLERPGADVQCHVCAGHAPRGERGERRLVEVQAGGGRGHRAGRARVDGLVARGVVGVAGARDVGWQRHFAVALEPVEERARAVEAQQEEAVLACLDDRVRATREVDAPAGLRQVAGAELGPRGIVADEPLDQHFDTSARGLAADRARVDHARVVEHGEVPGTQQRRQVGEAAVVERVTVDVEQPACAPRARGHLRDQLGRQRVVEVRQLERRGHAGSVCLVNAAAGASARRRRRERPRARRLGAGRGNRTPTVLLPADFESAASTSSAIPAR